MFECQWNLDWYKRCGSETVISTAFSTSSLSFLPPPRLTYLFFRHVHRTMTNCDVLECTPVVTAF